MYENFIRDTISHMTLVIFVVKLNISVSRISQIISFLVAGLIIWTFFYKYLWVIILFKWSWNVFLLLCITRIWLLLFSSDWFTSLQMTNIFFIKQIPLFEVLECLCVVKKSEVIPVICHIVLFHKYPMLNLLNKFYFTLFFILFT